MLGYGLEAELWYEPWALIQKKHDEMKKGDMPDTVCVQITSHNPCSSI